MDYIRKVDFEAIENSNAGERFVQKLYDYKSGSKNCTVDCVKTPPGGGSLSGLHFHDFDQIFYILEGTMHIEIEGKHYDCHSGSLILFPAGMPHRNWNGTNEPLVFLDFNTPLPDPNAPFSKPL